jgi:hypothetical protein
MPNRPARHGPATRHSGLLKHERSDSGIMHVILMHVIWVFGGMTVGSARLTLDLERCHPLDWGP